MLDTCFIFVLAQENLRQIDELNQPYLKDGTAVYGVTRFSDMSQDEFKGGILFSEFGPFQYADLLDIFMCFLVFPKFMGTG